MRSLLSPLATAFFQPAVHIQEDIGQADVLLRRLCRSLFDDPARFDAVLARWAQYFPLETRGDISALFDWWTTLLLERPFQLTISSRGINFFDGEPCTELPLDFFAQSDEETKCIRFLLRYHQDFFAASESSVCTRSFALHKFRYNHVLLDYVNRFEMYQCWAYKVLAASVPIDYELCKVILLKSLLALDNRTELPEAMPLHAPQRIDMKRHTKDQADYQRQSHYKAQIKINIDLLRGPIYPLICTIERNRTPR